MIPLLFLLATTQKPKICIDPGHPSEVGLGTRGKHLTEIRAAWIVAQELTRKLKKDGYQVRLTKQSEKEFVRNRKRATIANSFKADLMVRLHCDSSTKSGYAIYFPDRQGKSEGRVGPDKSVIDRSTKAAKAFYDAFQPSIGDALVDNGLLPDTRTAVGSKQGALTGSIFSKVPVLLVEMVTLTHPADEEFLTNPKTRIKMVTALEKGVLAAVPIRKK